MILAYSTSVKTRRYTATAFLGSLILAIIVLALAAPEQAGARGGGSPADETGTLMLVREWDAQTGFLTGWLPVHSVAMQLELLEKGRRLYFEPDEAVYLTWPPRRKGPLEKAHVRVSPAPRVFEGESWLPVKRDPNIVYIGKHPYLIRGIIFNGGQWRQSAKPSTARSFTGERSAR